MNDAIEIASLGAANLAAVSIYAGLNILLLMALGLNVSMHRRSTETSLGDGGNEKMACAVRAHGNHAEWFPGFIIGLTLAALIATPGYAIHALGAVFTAARVLHAWGLLGSAGVSFGRFAGSLLTLLCYLLLGAGLIVHALI